ncbi:TNT domain-containing protein [Photorhabdus laumondii]|uniref:TNT domain-containing protein n=1 Tax=Photorhabdus laumondii TaxID=2218628 RepID=UPI003314B8A8
MDNNALSIGSLFGSEGAKHFEGAGSLAQKMAQSGATPEEINAALTHYLKGQVPDGQDPAKGLIIAWGNFFGVPLDVVLSNEKMTPQKAAEIVAGGIPTSEAKLIQFAAAKAYLSLNKYATKDPSPQLPNRVAEKNTLAVDEEAAGWSQYGKYRNEKGDWNWPQNNGAIPGSVSQTTLPKGTILDRFGSETGTFVSPSGVPYPERSLAPGTAAYPPVKYEVLKPIPGVEKGTIAPAFGEPGGGIQYKLPYNIEYLIKNEYIKKAE